MEAEHIVVAVTGASGAGYGLELLRALSDRRSDGTKVSLIHSKGAIDLMESECGATLGDLILLVDRAVPDDRMDDALASGSYGFTSMVVCPCTVSTASKVHSSIADNLITRAAAVALKERRRLILAIRETPLSTPSLKALYELSAWGAVIMPISPPFYGLGSPTGRVLQRAFAGRVLDLLGIKNDLAMRYEPVDR